MNEIYLIEKREEGYYELYFYNSPALAYYIQKIPSARFIIRDRCWRVGLHDRLFVREFCDYAVRRRLASAVCEVGDRVEVLGYPDKMPDLQYPITHLKLQPYDYQRKGIQYMVDHKRCFNGDDMGLGKDQPYSEPILTPHGFVPMGDLKVGDNVVGADGKAAKVLNIFEQGIKDVYTVRFSDGTQTRCGLEHLWNVITPNWKRRGSGYKVLQLSDIIGDLCYEVVDKRDNITRKNYKYSIPLCRPVEFSSAANLPIPPYVLGVIIGDGCLTAHGTRISKPNINVRDAVVSELRIVGSNDVVGGFTKDGMSFTIKNKIGNRPSSTTEALRELGLFGITSKRKYIPDVYKYSTVQDRQDLLRGLIDTDGHVVKTDFIEYSTASPKLAEDVAFVARSLGYMARCEYRESAYNNEGKKFGNYRVYLYGRTCRKNKTITSIEHFGKELSRCIVVDNEDHLYLTRDFIVTHNTFQSIAAVSIARAYPCLVVAPATMKVTWQREFQRFIGKQAMILSNENKDTWHRHMETGTCNIFITNYESVKKYFVSRIRGRTTVKNIVLDKRAAMFKSVIIDESHRCCNNTALWSIYLEAICANKEYVWLLTGTPRITSNVDLIQQLQIMRRLEDFGGAARFRERYCQGPDKSSNLYELHYRLWEICYFRRDKAIALKDLPEKTRQYLTVDIDNRKEYEFAENDLIRYLEEYESASDATLKSAAKATAMVQINHLRQISARGKMKEAKQFIHDVIDGCDKLIVFAFHKSVMSEIMATFPGSVSVTGSDSQEKKQAAIDKFQNDPDCKLIALNYKSGGVGITLTAASRILFIEFPWTASDCEQAECRAHRNGQKNAVNCYYLLARNTIDERILEIIQKEREDSSVVTGAINNIEESIVDATLRHFKSKHKI